MRNKAFEYLSMSIDDRINYKTEQCGISELSCLKRPTLQIPSSYHKIDGRRYITVDQATKMLGEKRGQVMRWTRQGVFGEQRKDGRTVYVKLGNVHQKIKADARTVSLKDFYELMQTEQLYMHEEIFRREVRDDSFNRKGQREKFVTVRDAAKILYQLRRRKRKIEDWPTLLDLNEKSGMNLDTKKARERYCRMIEEGELSAEQIITYDKNGSPAGREYRIPPHEFNRVLKTERSLAELIHGECYTTDDLAKDMGISKEYVSKVIKVAEATEIFQPVTFALDCKSLRYVLTPKQARIIRERDHPNLKHSLGGDLEEIVAYAKEQERVREVISQGGMTTSQIAESMNLDRRTVNGLILGGIESDSFGKTYRDGNKEHVLSAIDAQKVLAGEVKHKKGIRYISVKEIARRMQQSTRAALTRIHLGARLGLIEVRQTTKCGKRSTLRVPYEDAMRIVSRELYLPGNARYLGLSIEKLRATIEGENEALRILNSGGMTTTKIAAMVGQSERDVRGKILALQELGMIQSRTGMLGSTKPTHVLTKEEVKLLKNQEIPRIEVIRRRKAQETITNVKPSQVDSLNLDSVSTAMQKDLVKRSLAGDSSATMILSRLYIADLETALEGVWLPIKSEEEKNLAAQTAFFEVLAEQGTGILRAADVSELVKEKLTERKREEATTWGRHLEDILPGTESLTLGSTISEDDYRMMIDRF
jgi:predicted transcriptional regulator